MASNPPNEHAREHAIEKWMLAIIHDGGVERFDDLHIDQIDGQWKTRGEWYEGGLEAFRLALKLRDRHQLGFTVGLGFGLESPGCDFHTQEEFMAKVDWSPPSLYLFSPAKGPRSESAGVREMNRNLFPDLPKNAVCYYIEFRDVWTNESRQSVFLEG